MNQANSKNEGINVRAFGSDVLIYSFGQALLLVFGLIQSLIIPKYLSTADYGYWQFFLLYTTYGGLLHLGFLEGILVRWAGKEYQDIKQEIPIAFRFLLLEQFLVVGILAMIIIAIDLPFLDIALAVLVNVVITNVLTFFIFTAQAVKKFKLVTVLNISRGALFLLLILVLFVVGSFRYESLYLATIATGIIIVILLTTYLRDILLQKTDFGKSIREYGKEIISIGIFVLLGNYAAIILVTIDRLIVGSFFSITQFAQYAFAMSMCTVVLMFVQAVSQVFFPYLSGSSSEMQIRTYQVLRPIIILFWAGALIIYFPFTAWVEFYLPHYTASLPFTAILLCSIGFSGQIQIIHANFFKIYRKQRLYFIIAGLSLTCTVALYILATTLFGTLTSIAITAVVSFGIWYLLNEFSLRRFILTDNQEVAKWLLVIGIYAGAFLVTTVLVRAWVYGMVIYLAIFMLVTSTVLKTEVIDLWNLINVVINRRKDKKVVQTKK